VNRLGAGTGPVRFMGNTQYQFNLGEDYKGSLQLEVIFKEHETMSLYLHGPKHFTLNVLSRTRRSYLAF
jgi:hypothetical protein